MDPIELCSTFYIVAIENNIIFVDDYIHVVGHNPRDWMAEHVKPGRHETG
jgi:hypothetical protein